MTTRNKLHNTETAFNEILSNNMLYSGPDRRRKDSPEFFGLFALECIERRRNGYSLLKSLNRGVPSD